MHSQDHYWSRAAAIYENEFVDPFRADVRSPLLKSLKKLKAKEARTVADLGCGIGPLLPFLAQNFPQVHAVDFAEGMIDRAQEKAKDWNNVSFHRRDLTDLAPLHGTLDVAVAVNSLVMPDVRVQEKCLAEVRRCLKPAGRFLGILPAMDAVHYQTMLLLDRALATGKPLDAARKNAAHHNDHADYDFAFGQFRFQGLEQHFWQPFEIRYRMKRAGFRLLKLKKVHLSWKQFAGAKELRQYPAPWDWFFLCRPK